MRLRDVERLARKELDHFGLYRWSFGFSRCVRVFGDATYGLRQIRLSRQFAELNRKKYILNVLLHEIAHALVGARHHHDHVFKAKAIEIGCGAKSLGSIAEQKEFYRHVVRPKAKYYYECPNCHTVFRRQYKRRSIACKKCCHKFNHRKWSAKFVMVDITDTKAG
jgi:predicted SprT family Zn-dependent metalloprotease